MANEVKRISLYLDEDLFSKLEAYCKKFRLSKNSALNMICSSFFDGQEAMKSMGNLADWMSNFSEKIKSES